MESTTWLNQFIKKQLSFPRYNMLVENLTYYDMIFIYILLLNQLKKLKIYDVHSPRLVIYTFKIFFNYSN